MAALERVVEATAKDSEGTEMDSALQLIVKLVSELNPDDHPDVVLWLDDLFVCKTKSLSSVHAVIRGYPLSRLLAILKFCHDALNPSAIVFDSAGPIQCICGDIICRVSLAAV